MKLWISQNSKQSTHFELTKQHLYRLCCSPDQAINLIWNLECPLPLIQCVSPAGFFLHLFLLFAVDSFVVCEYNRILSGENSTNDGKQTTDAIFKLSQPFSNPLLPIQANIILGKHPIWIYISVRPFSGFVSQSGFDVSLFLVPFSLAKLNRYLFLAFLYPKFIMNWIIENKIFYSFYEFSIFTKIIWQESDSKRRR